MIIQQWNASLVVVHLDMKIQGKYQCSKIVKFYSNDNSCCQVYKNSCYCKSLHYINLSMNTIGYTHDVSPYSLYSETYDSSDRLQKSTHQLHTFIKIH